MLVAINFNRNFTYLYTSFKGLAYNIRVLNAIKEKGGLPMLDGYYYLSNASYSNKTYLITLFYSVRYYL